ncbi:MAG: hypothetical protein ACTS8S_19715, partial [Giesbergeria sp.]
MTLKIPNNFRTVCKLQLIEGKAVVRDLLLLRRLGAFERSLYCKPYAFIVNIWATDCIWIAPRDRWSAWLHGLG